MAKGIIKAKVFRYNPDKDLYPSYKTYDVPVEETLMVLQVLKQIYEEQDRTLAFKYFACGHKFCNSCMMMINGKAKHACMTIVKPGEEVVVEPLKNYPVIRDLVVDFGRTVRAPEGAFQILKGAVVRKLPK